MTYDDAVTWVRFTRLNGMDPRCVVISRSSAEELRADPRIPPSCRSDHHTIVNVDGRDVDFPYEGR